MTGYIGPDLNFANLAHQTENGDGSTVAFTLDHKPGSAGAVFVHVGGAYQLPNSGYTVDGNTITFTSAPPTGTNNISIRFLGLEATIGVPADGSVSLAKISGSLITADNFINTISGTSHDFSIPSTAKKITISLYAVSTNGTSRNIIQLGDSGGIVTSGYISFGSTNGSNFSATDGFALPGIAASSQRSGVLTLVNLGGNVWVASGSITQGNTNCTTLAGVIALSNPLETLRLTTQGGTDTFDLGFINCFYE